MYFIQMYGSYNIIVVLDLWQEILPVTNRLKIRTHTHTHTHKVL